jgi:tRNA (guanine26-N2/guanine27-N2)-dimethyltransferase
MQANFARAVASLSKAQVKKVKRFLPNPEKNWGPKVRAGRQITSKHVSIYGSDVLNGDENGGDPLEMNNGEPSAKRQKVDTHMQS